MIRIVLATAIALALASCNRAEPTEPAQPEQTIRDARPTSPHETAPEPS